MEKGQFKKELLTPFTKDRAKKLCKSLGPRQLELLQYMALGHSNARIAHEMGVVPKTVKNMIRIIYAKMPTSRMPEDPRGAAVMLCHVYHRNTAINGEKTKPNERAMSCEKNH